VVPIDYFNRIHTGRITFFGSTVRPAKAFLTGPQGIDSANEELIPEGGYDLHYSRGNHHLGPNGPRQKRPGKQSGSAIRVQHYPIQAAVLLCSADNLPDSAPRYRQYAGSLVVMQNGRNRF
jgi:hypothetical protein